MLSSLAENAAVRNQCQTSGGKPKQLTLQHIPHITGGESGRGLDGYRSLSSISWGADLASPPDGDRKNGSHLVGLVLIRVLGGNA